MRDCFATVAKTAKRLFQKPVNRLIKENAMKPTCSEKTQVRIKISPNPSFPKRGISNIPPFSKGGRGGIYRMNRREMMNPLLTGRSVMLFVFMLTLFTLCNSADAGTRYAQSSGSITGACGSWLDACDLQYAISQAVSGDEVWVKAGIYLPTYPATTDPAPDPPPPPDRTISFTLKNGVAIYGGVGGGGTDKGGSEPGKKFKK